MRFSQTAALLLGLALVHTCCATRLGDFQQATKRALKQVEGTVAQEVSSLQSLWSKWDQQAAVAMDWIMPQYTVSDAYDYMDTYSYDDDFIEYDDYIDSEYDDTDDLDLYDYNTWAALVGDRIIPTTVDPVILATENVFGNDIASSAEVQSLEAAALSQMREEALLLPLPAESEDTAALEAQKAQEQAWIEEARWYEVARAQEEEWLAAEAQWRAEQRTRQALAEQPAGMAVLVGEIPVMFDRYGRAMGLPEWASWAEFKASYLQPLYLPDGTPDYRLICMCLLAAASISTFAALVLSVLELREAEAAEAGESAEHLEALLAGYLPMSEDQHAGKGQQNVTCVVNPILGSVV